MRKFIATLCTVTLLFASASLAVAQDAATIRAIFASAPKTPTTVGGVEIFVGPPKGFDPLTASGADLARYGLPQRPDQTAQPERYAMWTRAMSALKTRADGVRPTGRFHGPAKLLPTSPSAQTVSNVPTTIGSSNWSGIVNTNKLTKWSNATSFDEIVSYWPVPVAIPPFGACALSGINPPFLMSQWNGIDGFNSGDVVQGGSEGYSYCSGTNPGASGYIGWVEWYPSYSELEITCGGSACPVGPGDVMYAVTYATAGTATQTVFLEDTTQQWHITASLSYVSGPGVIGNSEEQVIERPCCNGSNYYALNNYNYGWFSETFGFDGHGTEFYAGSQATTTYNVQMYNDAGSQVISEVLLQGSVGNAGKFTLFFSDEGCAYTGGCVP
jgi:hypothetical protein